MNVITKVKNECTKIALDYGHEYVTFDHVILFLISDAEANKILTMFDVPMQDLEKETLNRLATLQHTIDSEEKIKLGLDVRRILEGSVTMRGSSMNVTIADIVYNAIDIVRQDLEDGNSDAIIAKLMDLKSLEKSMMKFVSGGKAGNDSDSNIDSPEQEEVHTRSANPSEKMFTELTPNSEELISHKHALKLALHALGQAANPLCVIVGDAYSGKSSVIQEIVNHSNNGKNSCPISGLKFISLNINRAMMSVSHDAGSHVNTAVKAAEREGAVLVIEDIHNLASSNYEQNIGTLLSRAAREGVKIICTTTSGGYAKVFEKEDVSSIVSKVQLKDPTEEEIILLLDKEIDKLSSGFHLTFEKELSSNCVELTKDHFRGSTLMNAIKILNRAASIAMNSSSKVVGVDLLEAAICEIKDISREGLDLTANEIVMGLGERMKSNVFGQDEAIDKISKAVRTSTMGFKENQNRPNSCIMMLGPTGTGKTETAIQMANELGRELIRLDMSEYQESHTVSKLLGAPAGYAGHNDGDGFLYDKINKSPDAIVLFDEIEKAHPNVFRLLLGAMDHGILTTSTNKQVVFKDTFLLFTSNIGVTDSKSSSFGLIQNKSESIKIDQAAYERAFSSEFRNRVDHLIEFNSLNENIALRVVKKVAAKVASSLKKSQNIVLTVDECAAKLLVSQCFSLEYGARAISRGFQSNISSLIIDRLIEEGTMRNRNDKSLSVRVKAKEAEYDVILKQCA